MLLLPASKDVYFQGKPLDFTAMASQGKVASRDRLSLRLYNLLSAPSERNIDTYLSRIRRKMGGGRAMILSVGGTGYQLCLLPGTESFTLLYNPGESN